MLGLAQLGLPSLATGVPAQTQLQTHPHSAPSAPPPSWSRKCRGPHRSHWSPGGRCRQGREGDQARSPILQLSWIEPEPQVCSRLRNIKYECGEALTYCVPTERSPLLVEPWCPRGEACDIPCPLPMPQPNRPGSHILSTTHHRHGQLQAQCAPADDQGQDPQ